MAKDRADGSAQTPQPASRFKGDNDEELLVYMSLRTDDPTAAEEAWAEFYNRHVAYLFDRCKKAYALTVGDLGVSDLVQDTFVRAFEKAMTFKTSGSPDADGIRRLVRGWLGKIANRLFLEGLRSPAETTLPESEPAAGVPADDPEPDKNERSPRVQLIREALGTLSERERHVLRVTGDWYERERLHQRVSKKEMAALAHQLQTTAVNIRQIRKRAIDKVRGYIQSHEQPRK